MDLLSFAAETGSIEEWIDFRDPPKTQARLLVERLARRWRLSRPSE